MIGITEIAGAAVLGAVLLQAVAGASGVLRRRVFEAQRQRAALDLFRARVAADLVAIRQEQERRETAWEGYRKFRIDRKVMEADDVCSFYFAAHDQMPLPRFRPGQYLTFQLRVPGQPQPVIRCYSLSDSPERRDYYRCTIKRVPPPRDKPDAPFGLASSFFHGSREGDLVDVRAPSGNFYLDLNSARPVVLIAGGIGITPVLSMLNAICDANIPRETWFFYGIRNRREHAMDEHLRKLAAEHDNVNLVVCYSDPTNDCVEGKNYDVHGWVSVDLFKRMLPSNNYEFYICGPPPMMQSVTQGLREWGVPEADVHFEAFGPATVKRQTPAPADAATAKTIKISFSRCHRTIDWQVEHGSLLETAEKHGIAISSGCRAGNCGTCETAVREGSVKYLIEPGFKPNERSCLPCVAVPESDLVLDA
ncbi:MAG TPA: 2Fe-2S iron-sulfur cluster-binding protein [Stellaceae bacterium]|nr:2Fe-2S iron-sulfur cluster-binding protein [Stellaceae bacterium]